MKIYKRICPNCNTQFDTIKITQVFCKKPCYYKFNNERLNKRYKEKRAIEKANPTYPKYIDDNGVEHQLDFYPDKEPKKFQRFKDKIKAPN